LADKRIFPAVNVVASGTRKEEILMGTEELNIVWKLRRVLHALEPQAVTTWNRRRSEDEERPTRNCDRRFTGEQP